MREYKRHALSAMFGDLDSVSFENLVDNMRTYGFMKHQPIITLGEDILDGWHRYKAALKAGVEFETLEFELLRYEDPLEYVIALNRTRRHLDATDKARIAYELENTELGVNQYTTGSPRGDTLISRSKAAKLAGSSPTSIDRYKNVIESGNQDLIERLLNKEISLRKAYDILHPPVVEELDIIETVPVDNTPTVAQESPVQHVDDDYGDEVLYDETDSVSDESETTHKHHLGRGTGNPEHYTPRDYLDAVHNVLGEIGLDPASNPIANENVRAKRFYTKEDDGLKQHWVADTLFINPPFSRGVVDEFAEKLVKHYANGDVKEAIWLSNNTTSESRMIGLLGAASAIFLHIGRLKFITVNDDGEQSGAGLQGQITLYFGDNPNKFLDTFSMECVGYGFVPYDIYE